MMEVVKLTYEDLESRLKFMALQILKLDLRPPIKVYGIPKGGVIVALLLANRNHGLVEVTHRLDYADVIVDDILDSGKTERAHAHSGCPFFALYNRSAAPRSPLHWSEGWVQFPWESDSDAQDIVVRALEYIGEDPKREGLLETPARVVRSWEALYWGYGQDPKSVFKTFAEDSCDEMVLLRNCEFYSMCEHHMLPFHGTASIAYIPNGRVLGVSKLARVLEIYARRLQIQERIGEQITTAIMELLEPLGAACILRAQHFCMTSRGVQKQGSVMVTSSLKGVFRNRPEARMELLQLEKE